MRVSYGLQLVNVVAGGSLDSEIDLINAFEKLRDEGANYEPEIAPGLKLQINSSTIMLFQSGKYHLTGAKDIRDSRKDVEELTNLLASTLEREFHQKGFEIRNLLYKGDFEREFDTQKIHADLPQRTEYNPKNHPSLYFRSNHFKGVLMVFRTGKFTITGITTENEAQQLVDEFNAAIDH